MPVLHEVLQGIKRLQATVRANKPWPRLPITGETMRHLKRAWVLQGPSYNRSMLWAASCTCFFGFLRSGEATIQPPYDPAVHLSLLDVFVDSKEAPSCVIIHIKVSKTDPFRTGTEVYLGRTDKDLCPVGALLSYINLRGLQPGPLFVFQDGSPSNTCSYSEAPFRPPLCS